MSCNKVVTVSVLILFLFSGLAVPCMAAQTPAGGDTGPARVAILPFTMNTPANLNYLQSGIRDMLSSRLSWQGKVQVLDKSESDRAAKGAKELSQSEAVRIGAGLKVDYVLYGSITSTGQSVSIDAKMVPVSGKTEPVSFFAQTKSLDDVMPQVNMFAQQINQKIFGKPQDKSQQASAEAEAQATRNPELLLPGAIGGGDKISYLNPNFIEVTPEGALRQPGLWRSQDFQGGILGMDVGDLDGDGKAEIVTMQVRKLIIYKKENQGLRQIAQFEGTAVDRFIWVSVADIYRDGKAYIFLTNLRTRNSSNAQVDSARDRADQSDDISSFVLSLSGGKLQVVAKNVPYFMNAVHLGPRGKVLIGQKQGGKYENAFTGPICELQLHGSSVVQGPAVSLPKEANVFNFAKADLNNDRLEKLVMLDDTHKLTIVNPGGDLVWRGTGVWGATTNAFEAKVEDRRWSMVEMFAIPTPILITDLRKTGIPEIVTCRNTTSFDQWMPQSMKYYDRGEIVSLSWDNLGLTENWKTRELNGQVTSLRLGDLEGTGKQQLVISMVYPKDLLKLWDARSVIFTYDLNVREGPPPPKPVKDEKETVPLQAENPTNKPPSDNSSSSSIFKGRRQ
jgi:TolB-like protein